MKICVDTYVANPDDNFPGYCSISLKYNDSEMTYEERDFVEDTLHSDDFLHSIFPELKKYDGHDCGIFNYDENFPIIKKVIELPDSFFAERTREKHLINER